MKKRTVVLVGLGIIVILLAAGIFFLLSNLDRIVAAVIEEVGSEATGTSVKVSSVRIKLREGEGSIGNLSVGNPRGFSTPNAASLGNITIALDTGSISGAPVIIRRILVSAPRITYEINRAGSANIQEIQKNVEAFAVKHAGTRGKGAPPGKEPGEKGKSLLIRSLIIEGGEVTVSVAAREGGPLIVKLPRIALSNLGGKGGQSPGEIAAQVLNPLMAEVARAAARAGAEQYLGKGADEAKKALEEKAREKAGEAGEGALRKLLGK